MPELKRIIYRGGLVSFQIPSTWKEEYEPDGGGTFYEDNPGAGTLRLNVLTMKSPREMTLISPAEALSGRGDKREIRSLPNGNAVARYIVPTSERGEKLELHYWEVANPVPPQHMRLGIFSYTILASQATDPAVQAELQLLDKSISEAEFAKTMGESGPCTNKPWWKFW